MKIIADNAIPFIRGVFEPYAEVVYMPGAEISSAPRDADLLIIRTRTRCDRRFLEKSRIGMIATATIGFDHIDIETCRDKGIEVATAAGSNARGVLQWFGAAMAWVSQNQGWAPSRKSVGVVGVGNVGSLIDSYCRQWGFDVKLCDPPREKAGGKGFVGLEEIACGCDIITFHTPLTRVGDYPTWHMASDRFFELIRPGSLVVNSSRGEVVDSAALCRAVSSGRCSCVIDTWEGEPSPGAALISLPLLSTPHIAGYTAQGKANATTAVVRAAARKFGLPLEQWYPEEINKVTPKGISWEELNSSIKGFIDIEAESRLLKSAPGDFERIRNNYRYRQEYF